MKRKSLLFTLAFAATAFVASANDGPGIGADCKKTDIAGGVVHSDTKKPIGNVSVTAVSNTNSKEKKIATTDNSGNYCFTDLKPGTYKLVFEKDGFKKVTKDKIMIRPSEGCQLNIEMDENEEFQIMPGGLFFNDYN